MEVRFSQVDSDVSWVSSLPRVKSPERPATASPPPYSTKSPPHGAPPAASRTRSPPVPSPPADHEQTTLLENQQRTIALLVSEKAALSAELEHLEDLESSTSQRIHLLSHYQLTLDNRSAREGGSS